MKIILKFLKLMSKNMKRKFYLLILLLFFAGLMELFGLAMILPVINVILEPNELANHIQNYEFLGFIHDLNTVKLTVAILLGTFLIYIFKNIYLLAVSWFQVTFLKDFSKELSTRVFNEILKKKYLYFTGKNSTNFIKIIANDAVVLKNNLNYCAQIISELFTITLISMLLFITHPLAMLSTVTLFVSGTLIFLFVLKKKTNVWAAERNLLERKRFSIIKQIISSIRDLKLLNIENKFSDEFSRDNNIFLSVNRKQELMLAIPRIWMEMITISSVLFLLFILIFLDDYKVIPKSIIPIMALFVGASFKLIPSFNKIITGVQSIRFVSPILDEFNDLIKSTEKNIENNKNNSKKIYFKKKLSINKINYTYGDEKKYILKNLTLDINRGEKIGLIGKSGSGKSTLLDIITGMLDEYEGGDVLIDGLSIKKGVRSWRNSINYLSQNSVFLDDTIKNNILLGSEIVDEDLIKDAINKSLLEELIQSLPDKENTKIGENAIKLSGGERQRIAFARLFYLKRDFLILDESTNALDVETEKKVLENIWSEFSDKTIIQVSHNQDILQNCDRIYKLSEGKLILV